MGVYHSFDCTLVYFLGSKKEKKILLLLQISSVCFFFLIPCVCVCVCVFIPCSGEIDTLGQNSVCFQ